MAKAKGRSAAAKSSSTPKMAGRINVEVDKDSSIGIRQIENGFIVSESGYTGKGKNKEYYHKEYFKSSNPVNLKGLSNVSSSGSRMKLGGKK